MSAFETGQHVHIVGIGGAGMSGLALLLSEMGLVVSGSDAQASPVLDELRSRNIEIFVGHASNNVEGADVVLWSPAVAGDNVEIAAGRSAGATLLTRSRAFYELSQLKPVVGLTGTHGKTTATSMMVHVTLAAGRDDAWLLGAPVLGVGANGHWGQGDLVLEVDESYGTFGELCPYALGLLNVEADHLDHYGSIEVLEAAFVSLIDRSSGPVVAWSDDLGLQRVIEGASRAVVTVGTAPEASWVVSEVLLERRGSSFVLTGPDGSLALALRVTGQHNVANAAVVAVLASALGIDDAKIAEGLSNFIGAPRRYQYRGEWRGSDVYEDYAHLPGEIMATLKATIASGYQKPLVVFQPHRVTRTTALIESFATSFGSARDVLVTDIYSAGEANPTGLSGEVVADAIRRYDPSQSVFYTPGFNDVVARLEDLVDESDVILILGAGDVGLVASMLPGGLK